MFPSDVTAAPVGGACEAEVARLCGTINVATAALVDVIAGVIASDGWGGYRSVEHWVSIHCGLSAARAKALCGLARRAGELPETLSRFREGRLSEDQVLPIARHVPARFEAAVADLAERATPSQIARVACSYQFKEKPTADDDRSDEERFRDERDRDLRRSLAFGWDDDGNLRGSFSLPADQGAVVKRALEASRTILFNERNAAGDGRPEEAQITWADAFVRMADIALGSDAANRPAADRYETLLHLRVDDLDKPGCGAGHLHLGPALSPGMLRYLTCDSSVRVILEKAGVPINEGRKYRTVPRKVRRTVEDRDRGCRFPGCTNTNWVDVHHIVHWRDGGPTDTHNLVCLCPHHHRLLHKGRFNLVGNADDPHGLRFTNHFGTEIPTGPRPAPPPDPPPKGSWTHPTGERLDLWAVHFAQTA